MKPCMDHIPAFIFLCSNLPKPLHRPPVFEERLECTHFTRSVTRLHVQLSPRKYCQQPQQEQEIPRACKSKQQQWQQALLRSQIIATTGAVSGSYAAPRQRGGDTTEEKTAELFFLLKHKTFNYYHNLPQLYCVSLFLLSLARAASSSSRGTTTTTTPSRPLRTFWTPYRFSWTSLRKTCQVSTVPERPKNYVDVDDSDEADIKTNVFPVPYLLEQAQYSQLQNPPGILTILDTS